MTPTTDPRPRVSKAEIITQLRAIHADLYQGAQFPAGKKVESLIAMLRQSRIVGEQRRRGA